MTLKLLPPSSEIKKSLIEKYPGLQKYFEQIEEDIQANPSCGSSETILLENGEHLPMHVYSLATNLFSGNITCYSKTLSAAFFYTPRNGGYVFVYQFYLD